VRGIGFELEPWHGLSFAKHYVGKACTAVRGLKVRDAYSTKFISPRLHTSEETI